MYKKLVLVFGMLAIAACVPIQNYNHQSPKGENVGEVVVFTSDESLMKDEQSVLISINGKFVASLKAKQQFSQGVCAGEYLLQARSVTMKEVHNKAPIQSLNGLLPITIEAGKTKYFVLEQQQNAPHWKFNEVSSDYWSKQKANLGVEMPKLVRRLPQTMMSCNNANK